ncbi:hypothetical protein [Clostridium ganghwense]|uniref:DUF2382 domain-containing protein n=1 Tax=Clostridium ganghwense TaxID=312089 RepID=A0ABT4CS19_9CLOT|nr:hypothetical protein [Clostridium ganghwense]MCY6371842.1 hypothetical protein [Clostridium ganghwense]
MQEIQEMQEMEEIEELEELEGMEGMEEIQEMEEKQELIKPIKKVIFKNNTQEKLGVKVNLTKDKEYDVLSVKVPVQYDIKPSVNNSTLYLIEDDNGERKYFRSNYFRNKEL